MTVWIGYLQWVRDNGLGNVGEPVLRKLDNFECMDAIIDLTDPNNPKEPEWPKVDFIVGNPPFLGEKLMRRNLGDEYVEKLFALYERPRSRPRPISAATGSRKHGARLKQDCASAPDCWPHKAFAAVQTAKCSSGSRQTGDIFFAESDREWILDGANVHISMVGFDCGRRESTDARRQGRGNH